MYTYQFQARVLVPIPKDAVIEFPNDASIKVVLGPLEAFGVAKKPSRLAVRGSNTLLLFDSNTGHIRAKCEPSLKPVNAILTADNVKLQLHGNILSIDFHCPDQHTLNNVLRTYLHLFPTLLNLVLADPPIVKEIKGRIGKCEFRWEYTESITFLPEMSQLEVENGLIHSYARLRKLNPRIIAALHYFHTASRLIVSGYSPWEFMSESILNMCKALQVLFGESMDEVRTGLRALDYSVEEIEDGFIPLMILRNYFDVGHSQVAMPNIEQVKILYAYLSESEMIFRELFQRLFEKESKENAEIEIALDRNFDKEKQKKFDQLISTMGNRLDQHNIATGGTMNSVKQENTALRVHCQRA